MNMERFTEWRSDIEVPEKPEIIEVRWLMAGALSILVAPAPSDRACLCVTFGRPCAFQVKDEGYRLSRVPGHPGFIWKVERSCYVASFREDAETTMDSYPLQHWLVMSNNQCVDVLCDNDPVVTEV